MQITATFGCGPRSGYATNAEIIRPKQYNLHTPALPEPTSLSLFLYSAFALLATSMGPFDYFGPMPMRYSKFPDFPKERKALIPCLL